MFKKLKKYLYSLIYGVGSVEEIILRPKDINSLNNSTTINQTIEKQSVAKDLINGELTEQVKELRYRTYLVDREAKKYEYFSPTLAIKRDKFDTKFIKYENSDNLKIVTLQHNKPIVENVLETLKQVDGVGEKCKRTIKIYRDFFPRFHIEDYTTLIVTREYDDKHHIVDFYINKYYDKHDVMKRSLISEIKNIRDKGIKSDMLLFDRMTFITSHAYNQEDLMFFEYKNFYFQKVTEYDGHYILRFKATIVNNGIDLTKQFYSASMDEKYKNKEKKNITLDLNGGHQHREYICADCGKTIKYDTKELDKLEIKDAREIDEEIKNETTASEFLDMEIIEQTFGKCLCNECLKKYIENYE